MFCILPATLTVLFFSKRTNFENQLVEKNLNKKGRVFSVFIYCFLFLHCLLFIVTIIEELQPVLRFTAMGRGVK